MSKNNVEVETPVTYYTDDSSVPPVRGDTILAFESGTRGRVYFEGRVTLEEEKILRNSIGTRHALAKSARQQDFDSEDILLALSFVQMLTAHYFVFANTPRSPRNIDMNTAKSVARGLDLLFRLEEFKHLKWASGSVFLQLSDLHVVRIVLTADDVTLRQGWLVPAWSENEIPVW